MRFNEQGKIEAIVPVIRNDAHRLIEECMLAANVCAADSGKRKNNQGFSVFMVHQHPPRKATLRDRMKEFGLGLEGGDSPTGKTTANYSTRFVSARISRCCKRFFYDPCNRPSIVQTTSVTSGCLTSTTHTSPHRSVVIRICWYIAPSKRR